MDRRIRQGLIRQLELRRRLLDEGRRPIGWKAGLGAPSAMESLGLEGPLVGFLTDASIIEKGAQVDISGWKRPVAEPEVAAWIGTEVPAEADAAGVLDCIEALGPAIEVADVDPPPGDVTEMLAGNVYHRYVMFGQQDPARRDLDGVEARITLGGDAVEPPADLESLSGRLTAVISHLAGVLGDQNERIRPGEVVICGSITPVLDLSPGVHMEYQLVPFDPLSLQARSPAAGLPMVKDVRGDRLR